MGGADARGSGRNRGLRERAQEGHFSRIHGRFGFSCEGREHECRQCRRRPPSEKAQSAVSIGGPAPSGMSARLSDQVVIHALNINGVDCMEMETARVRFFPNGTCDDMTMVLSRTDGRESTELILEPTTGMVWIESDRAKFRTKL